MVKQQEILLDTGPLLQLLVGLYDPKKLNELGKSELKINPENFHLLVEFIQPFRKKLVTPHVLAEVSNLAKRDLNKNNFAELVDCSIQFLSKTQEEIIPKEMIIQQENLRMLGQFGITDTALSLAANKDRLILTGDWPFFSYCSNKKIPILHTDTLFTQSFNALNFV